MEIHLAEMKPSTNYHLAWNRWVGRIAGDSPSGLVLVGGVPSAREVDLFDREYKLLLETTTSNGSGEYEFVDLVDRSVATAANGGEGYDVIIRGVIASGELDVIIPGVQPV